MNDFKSVTDRAWLLLLIATAITYWLGESGEAEQSGMRGLLLMMGLALFKGHLVIDDFMALRQAPLKWRIAMHGWLVFVLGMIILAYRLGQS